MESWDVVVVGAGPAALRAAIASHDTGARTLILFQSPGPVVPPSTAGVAVSLGETSPEAHIADTIALSGDSANKEAIRRICSSSMKAAAELEQWGMILRRDESGLPHLSSAPGHSAPRLTGAGDSTNRYVTQILDEQVLKRSIQRRQSHIPLSLSMDNGQVRGLTSYDLMDGEIKPYQCKSVILACEGYQGLWSTLSSGSGTAIAMAIRAGIEPAALDRVPRHPMVIRGTNIPLPFEILSAGGRYRAENGEDVDPMTFQEDAVADLRFMPSEEKTWFGTLTRTISDATGLDTAVDVVPLTQGVIQTTGGLPIDKFGRVTIESGKMWATGVFAAGPSASTGIHSDVVLPGNVLLDTLTSGETSGHEAGTWSQKCEFGGTGLILESLETSKTRVENLIGQSGISVGSAEMQIKKQASSFLAGAATAQSLVDTAEKVSDSVRITTQSRVMNQELVAALRILDLGTIATSIIP